MPTNDTDHISMKVYFSYKKKIKEPFYFLQIDKNLAIFGKIDQKLTVKIETTLNYFFHLSQNFDIYVSQVCREFIRIIEYRIGDGQYLGEPNVEIIYADVAAPNESFELNSLSHSHKGIDLRNSSGCCNEFDKITRNLRDRVQKVSSELHEMDVQIQKEFYEYMTKCQTIEQNVSVLFVLFYRVYNRK